MGRNRVNESHLAVGEVVSIADSAQTCVCPTVNNVVVINLNAILDVVSIGLQLIANMEGGSGTVIFNVIEAVGGILAIMSYLDTIR